MSHLAGFAVTGYRSIHGDLQVVGPLGKVNLIAGQNNSGKSNLLRYVHQYIGGKQWAVLPTGLDEPRVVDATPYEFAIAFPFDDNRLVEAATSTAAQVDRDKVVNELRAILSHSAIRLTHDELVWPRYKVTTDPSSNQLRRSVSPDLIDAICRDGSPDFRESSAALTGQSGAPADNLATVLERFSPLDTVPSVRLIGAFRQITGDRHGDAAAAAETGSGLVHGLQLLEQPTIDRQEDKERFERINHFLQSVLEDNTARLDIPHDAATILVQRGDITLPLEYLGTGVHQVVILAAAATLFENTVVCMEEPEVHLHPLLQRKLIRYLSDNTSNQYLIATHSAHLLDYERATVYHVQYAQRGTEVQRAGTPQQVADLCADLGYRPSDLLQANAVIWVEGPSDRIYLRHWITLVAPALIEGIHYSIMFYGGRLLNHLSAEDPEVNEFISLRRLNRHIAIMIDSDKTGPRTRINETKRRVRDEFDSSEYPGHAWITAGRTIENYVPVDILRAAIADVHPRLELVYTGEKWSDPLAVVPGRKVDKIKVAQAACSHWAETQLNVRDLVTQVQKIVAFIHAANGSQPA